MLSVQNTLTKQVSEIRPLVSRRIKMYSCGPTVYRPAHVGNLRTYLLADLIRRVLVYHGLEITSVMNITDVGHMTDELSDTGRDRMLLAVDDEGLEAEQIAAKYTEAFFRDMAAVNIRPFDHYPRATDHVPQIIELVTKLIEGGHAYEVDGTVYYDVTTFPAYGRLSHQSLDDMEAGHRLEEVDTAKRHHQDFVLWKAAGARRVLVFDSPWGPGFPGWHIECSAMSIHYLGDRFDIHTGGIDNRFPHHEDEIAQSEGAVGHSVVGTWVHGEHLLMGQAKMAKSAGNVLLLEDLVERGYDPLALRYLCFTARYRRQFHFTEEAFEGAATTLRRLREQVVLLGGDGPGARSDRALRDALTDDGALAYHDRFMAAVDDDLDFPAALRVVHEAVADEQVAPEARRALLASWDEILGLDLVSTDGLPPEQAALVQEREAARRSKDFARADAIRDELRSVGVELLDSADGTRWVRK